MRNFKLNRTNMYRLIVISCPFPITGGGERSFQVLRRIKKFLDLNIELIIPPHCILEITKNNNNLQYIERIEKSGVKVNDFSLKTLEIWKDKNFKVGNFNISSFVRNIFISNTMNKWLNYLKQCLLSIDDSKVIGIYSHHECLDTVFSAYYISKKLSKPYLILLQLDPFKESILEFVSNYLRTHSLSLREIINLLPALNSNIYIQKYYKIIVNDKLFKGFLSVSKAPIILSGLQNTRYKILKPANAFEEKLLKYRKNLQKKEDYCVFFARFSPEKGIFELPLIWKNVTKKIPDVKLIICGRQDPRFVSKFKKLTRKHDLEDKIILKGYVPREELFEIVSKAKVFIYPSHSDSFSLVTLESLAVGTPVVAYDIPAIKYTYGFTDAVKIVGEWNVKQMIDKTIEIFKMNEEEYFELLNDKKLLNFLKLHSSWENVTKIEARDVKTLLNLITL